MPLLEPILAPTPDRALRARGGFCLPLTIRVGGMNPAHASTSSALPPSAPAARFHSDFLAGGMRKRNGRQEAGAALSFQCSKKKKRAGFKYNKEQTAQIHQMSRLHKIRNTKWSLAIQNSLRNGEAQNLYALSPPSRPRAIIPAVLRNIIKRRGWLPEFQQ